MLTAEQLEVIRRFFASESLGARCPTWIDVAWAAVCRRCGQVVSSDATTPAELEVALRAAARGQTDLGPAVPAPAIAEGPRRTGAAAAAVPLTPRQREVLRLLAEGQTTKGIAGRLGISIKTVETHRSLLMDRLGIHDLAGLVRYAIRTGLVGWEA